MKSFLIEKWKMVFLQEKFSYLNIILLSFLFSFKSWNTNLNRLSANFTKWSNTLKHFVGKLPTNCLSVFDHFVNLALKGLNFKRRNSVTIWRPISRDTRLRDTVLFWYIRFADLICKTTNFWHRNEITLGLYRHTSMGNWSDQDHFVWGWKRFTVDSNYFKAVCWHFLFRWTLKNFSRDCALFL